MRPFPSALSAGKWKVSESESGGTAGMSQGIEARLKQLPQGADVWRDAPGRKKDLLSKTGVAWNARMSPMRKGLSPKATAIK